MVWRQGRFSALVVFAGFLVLFFYCPSAPPDAISSFWICFGTFFFLGAAIAHISFTWKRSYRCPSCEIPVMNRLKHGGTVPFNPAVCPNCGVRLR